jgi:hypothetical protein
MRFTDQRQRIYTGRRCRVDCYRQPVECAGTVLGDSRTSIERGGVEFAITVGQRLANDKE